MAAKIHLLGDVPPSLQIVASFRSSATANSRYRRLKSKWLSSLSDSAKLFPIWIALVTELSSCSDQPNQLQLPNRDCTSMRAGESETPQASPYRPEVGRTSYDHASFLPSTGNYSYFGNQGLSLSGKLASHLGPATIVATVLATKG